MQKIFKKIISLVLLTAMVLCLVPVNFAKAEDEQEEEKVGPDVSLPIYSVYSPNTGETLLSEGLNEKSHPYGLAKIMTAVIAMENADKNSMGIPLSSEMVTVGYEIDILPVGYNCAGFKVGDVVPLPDLITAMVVMNADDAAMTVAAYIGRKVLGGTPGSYYRYDKTAIEYFVELMNRKLLHMGYNISFFANPTGIKFSDDSVSLITFREFVRITDEFLKYDFLSDAISKHTVQYWDGSENPDETPAPTETPGPDETPVPTETPSFDETPLPTETLAPEETEGPEIVVYNGAVYNSDGAELTDAEIIAAEREQKRSMPWVNTNPLIDPDSVFYYPNCKGFMVCYNYEDKVVGSFYANYHDIDVVVNVYAAEKETAFADVIKLFDYVFSNYVVHTYIEDGQKVAEYSVRNAMDPTNAHLAVLAKSGGEYLSRIDMLDEFNVKLNINDEYFIPTKEDINTVYISPEAGIIKNTVLGTLDIYYGNKYVDSVDVYAGNTIPVYEPLPLLKEKKWYDFIDWENSVLLVVVIILILSIFILMISIVNNLKKQKRIRQYYANEKANKKPAQHYSKKKK